MSGSVGERAYLSIGEVLALLKDEFPDITISKIRFLESQGLLDPERTPSGYRKFYEKDVARLRWILQQQKDNFLPLKVIKGRLEGGAEEPAEGAPAEAAAPAADDTAPAATAAPPTPTPTAAAPSRPAAGRPAGEPAPARRAEVGRGPLDAGLTAASLTVEELQTATGLTAQELGELEKFGIVTGRAVAGQVYYDEDALVAAKAGAAFRRFGVEARHLRMFRTTADREAAFYEQLVIPIIKQRNPSARRQAVENLVELARLGASLREALLRQALREYTEGR